MMKQLRFMALLAVGVVVGRQIAQSFGIRLSVPAVMRPIRDLLPGYAMGRRVRAEGLADIPDAHLPNYRPQEPEPAARQPSNTPADQRINAAQWTMNVAKD